MSYYVTQSAAGLGYFGGLGAATTSRCANVAGACMDTRAGSPDAAQLAALGANKTILNGLCGGGASIKCVVPFRMSAAQIAAAQGRSAPSGATPMIGGSAEGHVGSDSGGLLAKAIDLITGPSTAQAQASGAVVIPRGTLGTRSTASPRCTAEGGACYWWQSGAGQPPGSPAGRWVSGLCVDMPGGRNNTKCWVPNTARPASTATRAVATVRQAAQQATTSASYEGALTQGDAQATQAFKTFAIIAGVLTVGGLGYWAYKKRKKKLAANRRRRRRRIR